MRAGVVNAIDALLRDCAVASRMTERVTTADVLLAARIVSDARIARSGGVTGCSRVESERRFAVLGNHHAITIV